MINLEEWMDIKTLYQQGHSQREIARLTGRSRETVSRVLQQKSPQPRRRRERQSLLDQFKPYVEQRYQECGLSCVRLIEEIRAMGYQGSVQTLRRFVHGLHAGSRSREKLTVRFETPPGEQSQADWASCGHYLDEQGNRYPVYAFVIVLSFSRMLYAEFTHSMDLAQLISCHQRAFEFFGGWTHSILYDNMKQVRLSQQQWNPLFLDFINHYGITPKTHRIRRPRTKGKVERMVHYLKDNFLNGRAFANVTDLNAQVRHWLTRTANVRVHATTGSRPLDLLPQETLTKMDAVAPYRLCALHERAVDAEGFVRLGRSRYSVPPEHVGQRVIIEQGELRVIIRCGDLIIAEHLPAPRPGACMVQKEHVESLWRLSLERSTPPAPNWRIGFHQTVATTPLTVYEEIAR